MEYVQEIPLSQVKAFDDWSDAQVGAILQLRPGADSPEIVVGMRCNHAGAALILILSGPDKGRLMAIGRSSSVAALEISRLVELRIKEPAPTIGQSTPPRRGWAYLLGRRQPRDIFLHVEASTFVCFAQLTGQSPGELTTDNSTLELGELVVARAPEPMLVRGQ